MEWRFDPADRSPASPIDWLLLYAFPAVPSGYLENGLPPLCVPCLKSNIQASGVGSCMAPRGRLTILDPGRTLQPTFTARGQLQAELRPFLQNIAQIEVRQG